MSSFFFHLQFVDKCYIVMSRICYFLQAILCAGLFPNAVKVGLGLESKGRGGKKRVRVAFRTK